MAVGGKSSWFSERGPCSASSSPRPRADPGCRWSHAIPKDKTKPFTPGFNSDLAAAGLKSAGDGQRGGKELIPPPSFPPPPLCFLLLFFPTGLVCCGEIGKTNSQWSWGVLEGARRGCSPGQEAQLGLYLLPPTFGVRSLFLEQERAGWRLWKHHEPSFPREGEAFSAVISSVFPIKPYRVFIQIRV